jgi:Polyketide cyclase / dehydrase and lipid transport
VADQTSASIEIAASPAEVMAVIADFEHYPEWVDSMRRAEVLSSANGKPKTVRITRWSRTNMCSRTTGNVTP